MFTFKQYSNKLLLLIFLYGATALPGCYPSSPDYIDDYDLVYTKEDKTFNFSTVETYYLPDSVAHIIEDPSKADHTYDARILQNLKQQLDALGWERLDEGSGDKADVVVLPSVSSQTNGICNLYCWWCYWGWYPGWGPYGTAWSTGYGWYYPPGMSCSTYNTGSVIITMTNPNAPKANELPIVWLGVANGLLEGSTSSISARIDKNMAQMFIQSPYLKQ